MTYNEWAKENWMYIDFKENAPVIWNAAIEQAALLVEDRFNQCEPRLEPNDIRQLKQAL